MSGGTLTCEVVWSVGRRGLDHLAAGGDAIRYLRLGARDGEQHARATVTDGGWRIDFEGDTMFGSGVSLIDDGVSLSCLSLVGRERLSVDRERRPGARFELPVLPTAEPRLEGAVLFDGRPGVAIAVDLEEAVTGARYRHRLLVDPADPAGALGVRLLELLIGDGALHVASGYPLEAVAALVEKTGTPAGASVELVDGDGELLGEIGSFRIHDVRRVDAPVDLLAGSEDFVDLRGSASASEVVPEGETSDAAAVVPTLRVQSAPMTTTIDFAPGPEEPLSESDASAGGPVQPSAPKRRANGGKEPEERTGGTGTGAVGPLHTTQAPFGLLVRQQLLSDVSGSVNRLLGPLAGATFMFAGGSGLTLDWLARALAGVKASADPSGEPAPGPATFLFSLAHDVQPPAAARGYTGPTVVVSGWGTIRGRGLLDRMAMKEAKRLLSAGALTAAMRGRLSASARAAVTAAGTDWSKLSSSDRLELAFAVLLETTGTLTVPLPAQFEFNLDDLVVGELTGYTGTLTLPPAASSDPGVAPLITLRCRKVGIDGNLMLGGLTLTGTLNRRPGEKYLLLLGLSVIAALAFPVLAAVLPLMGAIGAFILLDSATATVAMTGISASFAIRKTEITTTVTAATSVSLSSTIPTGLHQVVDLVAAAIANGVDALLNSLNNTLGPKLTKLAAGIFGLGFRGVRVIGSSVSGRDDDHLYLEALLEAPAGAAGSISVLADTRSLVQQDALRLTTLAPARRHYLSLVSSQNTLNVLLATAWARGELNAALASPAIRVTLRALAPPPYPVAVPVQTAAVIVNGPPRLTLAQAAPVGLAQHGTLEIDADLSLEPDNDRRYAWTFKLTTPVQVVVGSAAASGKPKIELLTASQQPIDVLLDLTQATAQVSTVHSIEVKHRTVTEKISYNGPPYTTITHDETYEVDTTTAIAATVAAPHVQLVLTAARAAFGSRDTRRAPRRDGVRGDGTPAGTADALTVLTYEFDGTDPDGADATHPPAKVAFGLVDLGFTGGLLFHHISVGGEVATILDPQKASLLTRGTAGLVLDTIGAPNLDPA